ncbi:hypothetical protein [Vibrio phage XZ1]|uniref:Uncharacterized protein n=2 Tax=Schizotequatrovirus TaxID=1198137 RepID=V9LZU8_9CAUD|nr:hypothetical protein CF80_gp061 [Vibrio phage VH7D]YP_009201188.1 hypothetical protein AVU32_gp085 [Vibrio phage ValKK3]QNJ54924.1 hypothetical protein vBValMR10Z_384 [Vibrio phage vB_ValM_R10Z]UOL51352.1 hypothetical protein [Vibrio phage XZ1]AGB06848.1 hypothetical protein [Vibrio phage VH7D]AJT60926.1 hypothetical protein [Vibrio phage ValKK3]
MKKYRLGNLLRGGWSGEFASLEEAWVQLGSRFLLSFPCEKWEKDIGMSINEDGGRTVYMYVQEENKYGQLDWACCKNGVFYMNERVPVTADDYKRCSDVEFF